MALSSEGLHDKFPFPDLPQDIGRIIFEIAASLNLQTGAFCALVSKQVKAWVEPVLYRYIRIKNRKSLECLSRTIREPDSTKPPGFFASHVKSLAFIGPGSGVGGDVDSLSILKACQGIESLHIWSNIWVQFREKNKFQRFFTSPSTTLSPKRLYIRHALSSPRDLSHFVHAVFRNLTHLEVDVRDKWKWDTLKQLDRLTHLAIEAEFGMRRSSALRMVTQSPDSLKVIIYWVGRCLIEEINGLTLEQDLTFEPEVRGVMRFIQDGQTDQRAVLGTWLGSFDGESEPQWNTDRILTWRYGGASRGGNASRRDFWTLAEEIIEKRRLDLATGEISYPKPLLL